MGREVGTKRGVPRLRPDWRREAEVGGMVGC